MKYHKIQSVFKRDDRGKLLEDEFSCPEFKYLLECPWQGTEKVDGMNIRVSVRSNDKRRRPVFGGRTDRAQIPTKLVNSLHTLFPSADKLVDVMDSTDFVLFGEGYGAGIQRGGGEYSEDQSFILFDVYCEGIFLRRVDVWDVASKLGIQFVPVVGDGNMSLTEWVSLIKGKRLLSELRLTPPEGVVLRPAVEMQTRLGERIIAKLKFKDWD